MSFYFLSSSSSSSSNSWNKNGLNNPDEPVPQNQAAGQPYDSLNPPRGLNPSQITTFNVGIRFHSIGDDSTNAEENIIAKHWALVFTPTFTLTPFSIQVELDNSQADGTLTFPIRVFDTQSSFPLGVYTGTWNDILSLMGSHPMYSTEYSAGWNNCQHWVAVMLVFIEAAGTFKAQRSFRVTERGRYDRVLGVLEKVEGSKLCHKVNVVFQVAQGASVHALGAMFGVNSYVTSFLERSGKGWQERTTFRDPRVFGL
ncbi:hypothetical protein TWF694_002051 [Orbilia ellipsospora]|uniref:Uncharacterized protein n=1 Tax=Orbilia ellipsospora TaxID=2528407 RepID=A0AAV9X6Z6_9PEZI